MKTAKIQNLFRRTTLRQVVMGYCEAIWSEGWKRGKTVALDDPTNPFVGGPNHLIELGIDTVTSPSGEVSTINKLTRLRVRDLSDESLTLIGECTGKDLIAICERLGDGAAGKDVVHQEYVDSFKENIQNDKKHLLNNLVAATAVLDVVVSFVAGNDTTVEELIRMIEGALSGEDYAIANMIAAASRSAWLGRACQDGSWEVSADFEFCMTLQDDVAEIDPWVAKPILEMFIRDLRDGKFTD
ncbi:hypothetical protein ACFL08_02500 [Patescibacteria group bacterium]